MPDNPSPPPPAFTVQRLEWEDAQLGTIVFPAREMRLYASFGSGLTRRAGDPPNEVWATSDRGPNVKPKVLAKRYGADGMDRLSQDGAKFMPWLEAGPTIAKLRIEDDRVELVETLQIIDARGAPVSGLPPASSDHAQAEPAFDLEGDLLAPDPSGLDTEGIAAFGDDGFILGDEFGPSLVRVDRRGRVTARHVPLGCAFDGAAYPVHATLPAIAGKRQLNRGFEALALSSDEGSLFLAFQSPLAHPSEAAHKAGRHVRIWRMDPGSLEVVAQYAYPLDPPETFLCDVAMDRVRWSDLKVSELAALPGDRLLVLERCSATTKLYLVRLGPDSELPAEHLDPAHRPTLEEVSGAAGDLPALEKVLLFNSDDVPGIAADMEGMTVLSPTRLLLVNDNDFGVEGAQTSFWLVTFEEPVFA